MRDNNVGVLLASLARKQQQVKDKADHLAMLENELKASRSAVEHSILTHMQVGGLYKMVILDDSLPDYDVWVCQRHTKDNGEDVLTRYLVKQVYAEDILEIPF